MNLYKDTRQGSEGKRFNLLLNIIIYRKLING